MKKLDSLAIFEHPQIERVIRPDKFSMIQYGKDMQTAVFRESPHDDYNLPFYCSYASESVVSNYFFQRRIQQRFLSIEVIYSGEFIFRNGNNAYIAEAGDIFLLHPSQDHDLMHQNGPRCVKAGIIFRGTKISSYLKDFGLDQIEILSVKDTSQIQALIRKIRDVLPYSASTVGLSENVGLSFQILQYLFNLRRTSWIPSDMQQVLEYLDTNYKKTIRIHDIGQKFNISHSLLNKKFLAVFKKTPHEYLKQLRMKHAQTMLLSSNYSIKEIAIESGYPTPLHFSAEFHRFYGMSPREYRQHFGMGYETDPD